jgi:pimeloyl-ACP methyl ester carboxylesterase
MSTTDTTGTTTDRIEVRSADGTPLAVWVGGEGPAVVLVHGSPSEHSTFDPLVAELRHHFTTFAMDRRGSGASGDTAPYAVEREFEDVAAVVDEAAARSGGPVVLWGHSYGANPAMGGAALSTDVHRLVLYEPSFGLSYPDGAIEAIEEAVAAGDRAGAVRAAFVDTGVMTAEEFDDFRASPRWPKVLDSVPTMAREARVEHTWTYPPGGFGTITAPTLLLTGSETPPGVAELTSRAAAAIPGSEVRVLEGHGHFAHRSDPAMVAAIVREFAR